LTVSHNSDIARNQTDTFRLDGSLTTQMSDKKVEMAFNTLQVKAEESLLHVSFTNTIGQGLTSTSLSWSEREREIGESEMNNFKCQRQSHLTKVNRQECGSSIG